MNQKAFRLKKDIARIYKNIGDIDTALKNLDKINESFAFQVEIAHLKYKKGEKKEVTSLKFMDTLDDKGFHRMSNSSSNLACKGTKGY